MGTVSALYGPVITLRWPGEQSMFMTSMNMSCSMPMHWIACLIFNSLTRAYSRKQPFIQVAQVAWWLLLGQPGFSLQGITNAYDHYGFLVLEIRQQPNTDYHKCNSKLEYSYNLCQLKYCWMSRFKKMRSTYGERFNCQLPGIQIEWQYSLPICQKDQAESENDTFGTGEIRRQNSIEFHSFLSIF